MRTVCYALFMVFCIVEGYTYWEPFIAPGEYYDWAECGLFCNRGVIQWNALPTTVFLPPGTGKILYGKNKDTELTKSLVQDSFAPKLTLYLAGDGTKATFYELTLKGNGNTALVRSRRKKSTKICEMAAAFALRVCTACDCEDLIK